MVCKQLEHTNEIGSQKNDRERKKRDVGRVEYNNERGAEEAEAAHIESATNHGI